MLNRRETLVLGAAAAILPALPAFAIEPANIAERFCRHLAKLSVTPVFNEEDAEFGKAGVKLTTELKSGTMLIQRHIDWVDPIVDGVPHQSPVSDAGLAALAANIAESIHPVTELKTYSLWVPNGIYEGGLVSHGHMRLRTLRSYMILPDEEEVILNRIDILFPMTGV